MSYIPIIHPVRLTEDDVSELKTLLVDLEQDEFRSRGKQRYTDSDRNRTDLKAALTRILNQIPRA